MTEKAFHKHLLGGLALLGAGVMTYLTRLHFVSSHGSSGTICNINENFSCDIVNKSQFSEILGIPVAVLGLIFFLAVLYLLLVKPVKYYMEAILTFAVFSLTFGLYLSWIENAILDSICIFCEASKFIMLGIILASLHALKEKKKSIPWKFFAIAVLVAVIFSMVAYQLQS